MHRSTEAEEQALLEELDRRISTGTLEGGHGKVWGLDALAFPKQLAAARDPSRNKVIVCGRQSGKTADAAFLLLDTAKNKARSFCLFIAPTRGWAKRIIWDDLLRLNDEFGLGGVPFVQDLSIRFPNGSVIALMGSNTEEERKKIRGRSYALIIIDEAQAWPFWLAEFIRSDIRPAQRNVRGTLVVQGTPPVSLEHPFHSKIWLNTTFSRHAWNIRDWPPALYFKLFGQTAEEALAQDLKDRGVTADDVTFRREMLGEFLADESALAYKFSPTGHVYAVLPKYTHCVFGIDLGWHDATVISVLVWDEAIGVVHLAQEVVTTESTFQELAAALKPLIAKYRPLAAVIDSSGNRQGYETIKAALYSEGLEGVSIERRKVLPVADQVGVINGALKSGRLVLPADSRAASDMGLVVWKKGIVGGALDGVHSDAIPALTYGFCWAQPLLPEIKPPAPPKSSYQIQTEALVAEHLKNRKAQQPWWEIEDDTDYADAG